MSDAFLLHRAGGVLTVTFNRPERLNAFRREEYHRFRDMLGAFEEDRAVRVVVLTGSGRGFCAGEDLKELDESVPGTDAAVTTENVAVLQDITRRMLQSAKVYVAAVNGVAAGFGAELSIACDLRLAGTGARFLFPEVRRGLFITNGVSHLLPAIVGRTWAATLFLTGTPIDAATAQRIGLVTEIHPADELQGAAQALAAVVAANAPTAVRLTKRILSPAPAVLEAALASETAAITECVASGEYIEGARAFVEKRPARWGQAPA